MKRQQFPDEGADVASQECGKWKEGMNSWIKETNEIEDRDFSALGNQVHT